MEPARDPRPLNAPEPRDGNGRPAPATSRSRRGGPLYKGEPLEPARGPGLGCFWFQVALLAVFVVLTPLAVANDWPIQVTAALLVATIVLLFFTGQTLIFLLRLVAADRRSPRRPLSSQTRTVGELEEDGGDDARE